LFIFKLYSKKFENLHIKPKMNQLDNEINDLLDTTKEKYNSILSEKINSLIEDKKMSFLLKQLTKQLKIFQKKSQKKF